MHPCSDLIDTKSHGSRQNSSAADCRAQSSLPLIPESKTTHAVTMPSSSHKSCCYLPSILLC
jgi:hypothetical protein